MQTEEQIVHTYQIQWHVNYKRDKKIEKDNYRPGKCQNVNLKYDQWHVHM